MKPKLDIIEFTDEQLDEMAIITDADIQIAHREITPLLGKRYTNLLLTLEEDVEDAFTDQSTARPAAA